MYAYISGKLVEKHPTRAVIDVQGIGYVLNIPASSFEVLPDAGATARLLTHHYVREDTVALYGFATADEKLLFETMLGVSGVGPRLALAALSAMRPAELRDVILSGDTALLTRIPGVGRKTAERLIVELKDRVARLDPEVFEAAAGPGGPGSAPARADALAALESLGLARATAEKLVRKVLKGNPGLGSAEEIVRLALREA